MVVIRKNCQEILEGRDLRNYVRLGKWARISRKCSGEVTRIYSQMYKSRTKIRSRLDEKCPPVLSYRGSDGG